MVISDLLSSLDDSIDFSRAASWDLVGLRVGAYDRPVGAVGVCHEVTDEVLDEADRIGIDTIVSYHPLLFTPTTSFLDGTTAEGRTVRLAAGGRSLIVVHTAFDAAPGGTAEALASAIGVTDDGSFGCEDGMQERCIGRFGQVAPMSFPDFGESISGLLGSPVRLAGEASEQVSTVAVLPGSGGSFVDAAAKVADVLVTGDVKHHDVTRALDLGLRVIDAGHIPTERPGVDALYALLRTLAEQVHRIVVDPHPWKD